MTTRLCLGNRGSDVGLFISKPGIDVMTATAENLLFSTASRAFQFVQSGMLAVPSSKEVTITTPDLGYKPMIMLFPKVTGFSANYFQISWVRYDSNTSITLHCETNGISTDGTVTYVVLRIPVG